MGARREPLYLAEDPRARHAGPGHSRGYWGPDGEADRAAGLARRRGGLAWPRVLAASGRPARRNTHFLDGRGEVLKKRPVVVRVEAVPVVALAELDRARTAGVDR